jgi:hypothetical protein
MAPTCRSRGATADFCRVDGQISDKLAQKQVTLLCRYFVWSAWILGFSFGLSATAVARSLRHLRGRRGRALSGPPSIAERRADLVGLARWHVGSAVRQAA